jgi:hypothetical protein
MKSFLTVLVVPSAMISKKEAHSPQLKPSANNDVLCCGLVRFDVSSRAMRASASCCIVISGVLKKEAVSAQTVSLNGRGSAKKRSERLCVVNTSDMSRDCRILYLPQAEVVLQYALTAQSVEVERT